MRVDDFDFELPNESIALHPAEPRDSARMLIVRPGEPLDANGRYLPVTSKYPSATGSTGFKSLSDRIHALGLRFGIHIMRGVPRMPNLTSVLACERTLRSFHLLQLARDLVEAREHQRYRVGEGLRTELRGERDFGEARLRQERIDLRGRRGGHDDEDGEIAAPQWPSAGHDSPVGPGVQRRDRLFHRAAFT